MKADRAELIRNHQYQLRNIREMQDQSQLLWYRARELVRKIEHREWYLQYREQPNDSLERSITQLRGMLDRTFTVIRSTDDAAVRCHARAREIEKQLRPTLTQRATAALMDWFWPAIIIQAVLSGKKP